MKEQDQALYVNSNARALLDVVGQPLGVVAHSQIEDQYFTRRLRRSSENERVESLFYILLLGI